MGAISVTGASLPVPILVLFFSLITCTQPSPIGERYSISGHSAVIKDVPFVKQKDKFCGPAAMASVMRFYGQDINQDEIADHVYTPKLRGALISDMESFAREMGYKAETRNGDIDTLISTINEGIPTILIVDLGKWVVSVPHYYVVYGYDKNRDVFLLHTGFKASKEIGFSKLDNEWEKMNRLMLVVRK